MRTKQHPLMKRRYKIIKIIYVILCWIFTSLFTAGALILNFNLSNNPMSNKYDYMLVIAVGLLVGLSVTGFLFIKEEK